MESESGGQAPKDYDIGYGKPPVQTRFRKGQKPPPRKKKRREDVSPRDLLWRILQEERRVVIDGKVRWMRVAEIILNKAFLLADKGNATLQRLVTEIMMMSGEPEREHSGPRVILDPHSTHRTGTAILRRRP